MKCIVLDIFLIYMVTKLSSQYAIIIAGCEGNSTLGLLCRRPGFQSEIYDVTLVRGLIIKLDKKLSSRRQTA